jgi:hypothetical protein
MSLLIQEPPLQVLPSLAVKLGLNDAIILQQIHYWLLRSNFEFDQKKWVYNSLKDWQKQFPFFSEDTIYRAFKRLEADGYLLSKMLSKNKFDRTKYYTIDYSKLNEPNTAFCADRKTAACDTPTPHFADISNTENTTETSITENTAENIKPAAPKKALSQIVSKKFEPQKMELPECVSSGAWEEWIAYRRQRKLSCAEITLNAQLRNLEGWHNDGHNANDIISRSIANGWQGLFEPKNNQSNATSAAQSGAEQLRQYKELQAKKAMKTIHNEEV